MTQAARGSLPPAEECELIVAQLLYDGFLQVLHAMRTLCFSACRLLVMHK
jgi:hypothetical protein